MKNQTSEFKKAREALKKCWNAIGSLVMVIPNSEALKTIKTALKDVEYGYEDTIKKLENN